MVQLISSDLLPSFVTPNIVFQSVLQAFAPIVDLLVGVATVSLEYAQQILRSSNFAATLVSCMPYCWNPASNTPIDCPAIQRILTIQKTGFYCINNIAL